MGWFTAVFANVRAPVEEKIQPPTKRPRRSPDDSAAPKNLVPGVGTPPRAPKKVIPGAGTTLPGPKKVITRLRARHFTSKPVIPSPGARLTAPRRTIAGLGATLAGAKERAGRLRTKQNDPGQGIRRPVTTFLASPKPVRTPATTFSGSEKTAPGTRPRQRRGNRPVDAILPRCAPPPLRPPARCPRPAPSFPLGHTHGARSVWPQRPCHRHDIYSRLRPTGPEHPPPAGRARTDNQAVIDEKLFAFKDEGSSNRS